MADRPRFNSGVARSVGLAAAVAMIVLLARTDLPANRNSMGESRSPHNSAPSAQKLQAPKPQTGAVAMDRGLASILGSGKWLDQQPLQATDLRGKVVLVNFWTYSCINSLRPLPYLKAWADKYRERGLVVIGIHTPEFEFEKNISNVRQAVGALGIKYPVRLDSDFSAWRKFENRAWPAFYFIDAEGRKRRQTFGEGDYAEAEQVLQNLLNEADGKSVDG